MDSTLNQNHLRLVAREIGLLALLAMVTVFIRLFLYAGVSYLVTKRTAIDLLFLWLPLIVMLVFLIAAWIWLTWQTLRGGILIIKAGMSTYRKRLASSAEKDANLTQDVQLVYDGCNIGLVGAFPVATSTEIFASFVLMSSGRPLRRFWLRHWKLNCYSVSSR